MKELDKLYVNTLQKLFEETQNLQKSLEESRKSNPHNWLPWVLFLIRIFGKLRL